MNKRFLSLDIARAIALILMVVYHILFILNFYSIKVINVSSGLLKGFGVTIGFFFIFIVGISLYLSYFKRGKVNFSYYLKRGALVLSLGILINLVTYFALGEVMVVFGILHLIGLSIILGHFFLRFRKLNIILGGLFVALGLFLKFKAFNFSYLVWLGFKPLGFASVDYYPLLPWFGVVLLGISFGESIYKSKKVAAVKNKFLLFLAFLGRHTLVIYLVHIPLIILVLIVLGQISWSSIF
jgi:uncharacterized membrane protein